jgi:hypothetical protein
MGIVSLRGSRSDAFDSFDVDKVIGDYRVWLNQFYYVLAYA